MNKRPGRAATMGGSHISLTTTQVFTNGSGKEEEEEEEERDARVYVLSFADDQTVIEQDEEDYQFLC